MTRRSPTFELFSGGPRHHEHEAAVRHVPAVDLEYLRIREETRDLPLRIAAVVDRGIADPAAAIVRAQHLSPLAPFRRIGSVARRSLTRHRVREDRADLPIRALADGWLVPEEDDRFSGPGVAQAAA